MYYFSPMAVFSDGSPFSFDRQNVFGIKKAITGRFQLPHERGLIWTLSAQYDLYSPQDSGYSFYVDISSYTYLSRAKSAMIFSIHP